MIYGFPVLSIFEKAPPPEKKKPTQNGKGMKLAPTPIDKSDDDGGKKVETPDKKSKGLEKAKGKKEVQGKPAGKSKTSERDNVADQGAAGAEKIPTDSQNSQKAGVPQKQKEGPSEPVGDGDGKLAPVKISKDYDPKDPDKVKIGKGNPIDLKPTLAQISPNEKESDTRPVRESMKPIQVGGTHDGIRAAAALWIKYPFGDKHNRALAKGSTKPPKLAWVANGGKLTKEDISINSYLTKNDGWMQSDDGWVILESDILNEMKCPKCRASCPKNATNCGHCGAKMKVLEDMALTEELVCEAMASKASGLSTAKMHNRKATTYKRQGELKKADMHKRACERHLVRFFKSANVDILKKFANIRTESYIEINGYPFLVEWAAIPEKRELGLMYRDEMPIEHGMLFDFEEEKQLTMWMENTHIPLDMIFISEAGEIVDIYENARPDCRDHIVSDVPARYVLEINAGIVAETCIQISDRIDEISQDKAADYEGKAAKSLRHNSRVAKIAQATGLHRLGFGKKAIRKVNNRTAGLEQAGKRTPRYTTQTTFHPNPTGGFAHQKQTVVRKQHSYYWHPKFQGDTLLQKKAAADKVAADKKVAAKAKRAKTIADKKAAAPTPAASPVKPIRRKSTIQKAIPGNPRDRIDFKSAGARRVDELSHARLHAAMLKADMKGLDAGFRGDQKEKSRRLNQGKKFWNAAQTKPANGRSGVEKVIEELKKKVNFLFEVKAWSPEKIEAFKKHIASGGSAISYGSSGARYLKKLGLKSTARGKGAKQGPTRKSWSDEKIEALRKHAESGGRPENFEYEGQKHSKALVAKTAQRRGITFAKAEPKPKAERPPREPKPPRERAPPKPKLERAKTGKFEKHYDTIKSLRSQGKSTTEIAAHLSSQEGGEKTSRQQIKAVLKGLRKKGEVEKASGIRGFRPRKEKPPRPPRVKKEKEQRTPAPRIKKPWVPIQRTQNVSTDAIKAFYEKHPEKKPKRLKQKRSNAHRLRNPEVEAEFKKHIEAGKPATHFKGISSHKALKKLGLKSKFERGKFNPKGWSDEKIEALRKHIESGGKAGNFSHEGGPVERHSTVHRIIKRLKIGTKPPVEAPKKASGHALEADHIEMLKKLHAKGHGPGAIRKHLEKHIGSPVSRNVIAGHLTRLHKAGQLDMEAHAKNRASVAPVKIKKPKKPAPIGLNKRQFTTPNSPFRRLKPGERIAPERPLTPWEKRAKMVRTAMSGGHAHSEPSKPRAFNPKIFEETWAERMERVRGDFLRKHVENGGHSDNFFDPQTKRTLSTGRTRELLRKHGLKANRKVRPKKLKIKEPKRQLDLDKVRELHKQGNSHAQIALQTGYSKGHVARHVDRMVKSGELKARLPAYKNRKGKVLTFANKKAQVAKYIKSTQSFASGPKPSKPRAYDPKVFEDVGMYDYGHKDHKEHGLWRFGAPAYRHRETQKVVAVKRGKGHSDIWNKHPDIPRNRGKYERGFWHTKKKEFVGDSKTALDSVDQMTKAQHQAWLKRSMGESSVKASNDNYRQIDVDWHKHLARKAFMPDKNGRMTPENQKRGHEYVAKAKMIAKSLARHKKGTALKISEVSVVPLPGENPGLEYLVRRRKKQLNPDQQKKLVSGAVLGATSAGVGTGGGNMSY